MQRTPHQNVATVLVDPQVLRDLELDLVERDLWLWPVATAPVSIDGPRQAFQIRRRMVESRRGAWDDAAEWVPAWVAFGESWYDVAGIAEPLPWAAHQALWAVLGRHGDRVRYRKWIGGVPRIEVPRDRVS
jgi:hypothetical protein